MPRSFILYFDSFIRSRFLGQKRRSISSYASVRLVCGRPFVRQHSAMQPAGPDERAEKLFPRRWCHTAIGWCGPRVPPATFSCHSGRSELAQQLATHIIIIGINDQWWICKSCDAIDWTDGCNGSLSESHYFCANYLLSTFERQIGFFFLLSPTDKSAWWLITIYAYICVHSANVGNQNAVR